MNEKQENFMEIWKIINGKFLKIFPNKKVVFYDFVPRENNKIIVFYTFTHDNTQSLEIDLR
jgi:hypothetical protein